MYILLCGTGVGFSVERQFIAKLPDVSEEFHDSESTITVSDSKIGWASAFRELLSLLYAGKVPKWDMSRIRPAGARLKTFGGRASGPEPLDDLFRFTVGCFRRASGRRLTSLECHDLVCKVADTVVVGGVRRSACISLSNLSDDRMRRAKVGQWWLEAPARALSNNSVAYTERPDFDSFFKEWRNQYKSRSGERGIINRVAFKKKAEACGRDSEYEFGANPCGEIILRPNQFCNLSEVVVRPEDTLQTLERKVKLATILGTLQATLTDFRYLRKVWKNNTEEERLLGVSFTGVMDHPVMSDTNTKLGHMCGFDCAEVVEWLTQLKKVAYETNKEWAEKLGISPAKAITCVKPSGTVSQLVDSSSGMHPRLYPYYVRTVMSDKKDPMAQFLIDEGIIYNEDKSNYYFKFPMKSPDHSVKAEDITPLDQLKLWKIYQDNWCDHNPSQTIYYRDEDYFHIGAWVWDNFDHIGGLSFFPEADHIYENAPYVQIDEEQYEALVKETPSINWSKYVGYEFDDNTTSSQEYACAGGSCEV
jgi:ribonucleoside-diphosphate reductase alpha chain